MPETGEISLASNPDQSGSGATRQLETIRTTVHVAEVITPALPPDATAYSVNSVTIPIGKVPGQTGTTDYLVALRRVDAQGKPATGSTGIIDEARVPVANLQFIQPGQFPPDVVVSFANAKNLDKTQIPKFAVCVAPQSFSPYGYVTSQTGGTQTPSDMAFCTSTTGGTIWGAPQTGKDLVCEVKGTATTP